MEMDEMRRGRTLAYKQTFISNFGGSRIIVPQNANRIGIIFTAAIGDDFAAGVTTALPIGIFDTGVLLPVINLTSGNPNERFWLDREGQIVFREWQFGTPLGGAAILNLTATEILLTFEQ